MRTLIFLLTVVSIASCNRSDESSISESGVMGVWLLSEEGYSPGSGYIVKPVPPEPSQTIRLSGEDQFTSTVKGTENFKFYTLVTDQNENLTLSIYVTKPDPMNAPDPSRRSFLVEFDGPKLKLVPSFPGMCIEGCHLGFIRLYNTLE